MGLLCLRPRPAVFIGALLLLGLIQDLDRGGGWGPAVAHAQFSPRGRRRPSKSSASTVGKKVTSVEQERSWVSADGGSAFERDYEFVLKMPGDESAFLRIVSQWGDDRSTWDKLVLRLETAARTGELTRRYAAWVVLGKARVHAGDISGARDAFQQARKLLPQPVAAYWAEAQLLVGDSAGEQALLTLALGRVSLADQPQVMRRLIALALDAGDVASARRYAQQQDNLEGGIRARLDVAVELGRRGSEAEARDELVRLSSTSGLGPSARGRVYVELGRLELGRGHAAQTVLLAVKAEALTLADKAVIEAAFELDFLGSRQLGQLQLFADRARAGRTSRVQLQSAQAFVELGQRDAARAVIERILAMSGSEPDLLERCAGFWEAAGELEAAARLYREQLRRRPQDWKVRGHLLELWLALGKLPLVREELGRAARSARNSSDMRRVLDACDRLGLPAECESYERRFLQSASSELLFELGERHHERGEKTEALALWRRAVEVQDDPKSRLRHAELLLTHDEPEAALVLYVSVGSETELPFAVRKAGAIGVFRLARAKIEAVSPRAAQDGLVLMRQLLLLARTSAERAEMARRMVDLWLLGGELDLRMAELVDGGAVGLSNIEIMSLGVEAYAARGDVANERIWLERYRALLPLDNYLEGRYLRVVSTPGGVREGTSGVAISSEDALLEQASRLRLSGRVLDARDVLVQGIARRPRSARLRSELARVLMDLGERGKAEVQFREGLECEPGRRDLKLALADLLSSDSFPGAWRLYVELLRDGARPEELRHVFDVLTEHEPNLSEVELSGCIRELEVALRGALEARPRHEELGREVVGFYDWVYGVDPDSLRSRGRLSAEAAKLLVARSIGPLTTMSRGRGETGNRAVSLLVHHGGELAVPALANYAESAAPLVRKRSAFRRLVRMRSLEAEAALERVVFGGERLRPELEAEGLFAMIQVQSPRLLEALGKAEHSTLSEVRALGYLGLALERSAPKSEPGSSAAWENLTWALAVARSRAGDAEARLRALLTSDEPELQAAGALGIRYLLDERGESILGDTESTACAELLFATNGVAKLALFTLAPRVAERLDLALESLRNLVLDAASDLEPTLRVAVLGLTPPRLDERVFATFQKNYVAALQDRLLGAPALVVAALSWLDPSSVDSRRPPTEGQRISTWVALRSVHLELIEKAEPEVFRAWLRTLPRIALDDAEITSQLLSVLRGSAAEKRESLVAYLLLEPRPPEALARAALASEANPYMRRRLSAPL